MNLNPFNRPFWDGSKMRRRHPGEKRGYSAMLLFTQLVGSLLTLAIPAACVTLANRVFTREKKPMKHA